METLYTPPEPGSSSTKRYVNRKTLIVTFLAVCIPAVGWFAIPAMLGVTDPSLADHERLAESLRVVDDVQLFEGLPHQGWQPELLQAELEANSTVQFGEFPFYSTPLELESRDRSTLVNLIGSVYSFRAIDRTSAKGCGGFHPDYCLVWQVGTDSYYALICFGCREFKAKGGQLNLHCEFRHSAFRKLEQTLRSYRKNRPPPT